jgi:hypothetical protein
MKQLCVLLVVGSLAARLSLGLPIANGSFEDGLTGWTLDAKLNVAWPVANARAIELLILDRSQIHHALAQTTSSRVVDGSAAAEIKSAEVSEFYLLSDTGELIEQYGGGYSVFLYQDIFLRTGETLAGSAKFLTGETQPEFSDFARVSVGNESIWDFGVSDLPSGGGSILNPEGPWETWQYTAPSDGTYRLKLELHQDDQISSRAFFDNIRTSNVPDGGATGGFLGIGLAVLAFVRKKLS